MARKISQKSMREEIVELKEEIEAIKYRIDAIHDFFQTEYPGKMLCRECLKTVEYKVLGNICNDCFSKGLIKRMKDE